MPVKPKTFDDCLAAHRPDQRAALEKLRKTIHAAAPGAEEYVGYGLAAFRLNGKPLVALGASTNHFAFYLMSGTMVETFAADLKNHDTSKGTIRFPADKPLPAALVKKLVKARIAENAAINGKAKKPGAASKTQTDPEVVEFLRKLDHPKKKEIEAVRQIILGASPEVREGIKWHAPSFRTTDYFATLNLRGDRVWLILHTGAKVKASATKGVPIADPTGLLKWLAKDRALVTFENAKDVAGKKKALETLVREWIGGI